MIAETATWPVLPVQQWQPTRDTVHLWTQIVGKTRLGLEPPLNHWWNATLYVSPRGLTTSLMPYAGGSAEVEFDFTRHELTITTTRGGPPDAADAALGGGLLRRVPLAPRRPRYRRGH